MAVKGIKVNGKIFEHFASTTSKAEAEKLKARLKKRGASVRTVKMAGYYRVYHRYK